MGRRVVFWVQGQPWTGCTLAASRLLWAVHLHVHQERVKSLQNSKKKIVSWGWKIIRHSSSPLKLIAFLLPCARELGDRRMWCWQRFSFSVEESHLGRSLDKLPTRYWFQHPRHNCARTVFLLLLLVASRRETTIKLLFSYLSLWAQDVYTGDHRKCLQDLGQPTYYILLPSKKVYLEPTILLVKAQSLCRL
jgi:hypothetical protein